MLSQLLIGCRHAASRSPGCAEYLESPTYPTGHLMQELSAALVPQIPRAEEQVKSFLDTGNIGTLDEAFAIINDAARATTDEQPQLGLILSTCDIILDIKYVRTAEACLRNLNLAVALLERAIRVTPAGPEHRLLLAARRSSLSNWLGRLSEWQDGRANIELAVAKARLATDLVSKSSDGSCGSGSIAAGIWNNFGYWLGRRFDHGGGDPMDLESAVTASKDACERTADDDPLYAARQNNLAVRLIRWHRQAPPKARVHSDITAAIGLTELALRRPGVIGADFPCLLSNLGNNYLEGRMTKESTPGSEDVSEALVAFRKAVAHAGSAEPPNHADLQLRLGEGLGALKAVDERIQLKDLEDSLEAFRAALANPWAWTETRILAAYRAALSLAKAGDWSVCCRLLEEAVDLLTLLPTPALHKHHHRALLASLQGLGTEAAAAALAAGREPYRALCLLETARSVIPMGGPSSSADLYGTLSSTSEAECPELWQFAEKRWQLDSLVGCLAFPDTPLGLGQRWKDRAEKEGALWGGLQELARKIRPCPPGRAAGFLGPPGLDALRAEARECPIVVLNISAHRSDALIVRDSGVTAIRLEQLTCDAAIRISRGLRSSSQSRIGTALASLWQDAAHPILDELGFKDSLLALECPRVVWVLPGIASLLPMHAAGKHVACSTETVIDRAMSSYSPSVKSLAEGRLKMRATAGSAFGALAPLFVSTVGIDGVQDVPYIPCELVAEGRVEEHSSSGSSGETPRRTAPAATGRPTGEFWVYFHPPLLPLPLTTSPDAVTPPSAPAPISKAHLVGAGQPQGIPGPTSEQYASGTVRVAYEALHRDGLSEGLTTRRGHYVAPKGIGDGEVATDREICRRLHFSLRGLRKRGYETGSSGRSEQRDRPECVKDLTDMTWVDKNGIPIEQGSTDPFSWVGYFHIIL